MRKFFKIALLAICLCLVSNAVAQKYELNAFEKQNKPMLKLLKKQYGTTPEVKLSDDGYFYILLTKSQYKNGPQKYMLIDEAGSPLCPEWLDKYSVLKGGFFYVGQNSGSSTKWGVVDSKGKQILPIRYDNIQQSGALEAGTFTSSSNTYWHPASKGFWLVTDNATSHHAFYSLDGSSVMHEYDGEIKPQLSYFWTIAPKNMLSTGNKKGLLTFDGEIIFPQEYNHFYIEPSGFVNCYKKESDGLSRCGGKMLKGATSDIIVPPLFQDVTYNSSKNAIECKIHRDEEYEVYNPQKSYEVVFRDKGERLYDMGKYQDVITFYEGEGYGIAWGDYYMGLSAEKIAKAEMNKLNSVINTLNDNTNYYLPIQNPDNYKFDAGTISGMYTSAGIYLEKYINSEKISADDPTLAKARKMRGEIITARNNVTKKIEEYGTALRSATAKNIERERKIAEEKALQAQREAAAARAVQQLSSGITNLILGGRRY
ncbi:MAG: hypothetical protein J6W52_04795 [Bacteroidaceae bacterium]|nr:hypothetical protein [Bacteroidaceae bacterium]